MAASDASDRSTIKCFRLEDWAPAGGLRGPLGWQNERILSYLQFKLKNGLI
jgi:hypothetical protein